MVKTTNITVEKVDDDKRYVVVELMADTREEVEACGSSGANVVGLTENDTMTLGSMVLCADGSLGMLDSNGQWSWESNSNSTGGGGVEFFDFYVKVTEISDSGFYGESDKSAEEIIQAYKSGKIVRGYKCGLDKIDVLPLTLVQMDESLNLLRYIYFAIGNNMGNPTAPTFYSMELSGGVWARITYHDFQPKS